ncbi:hypothetical protein PINS_up022918 [Pythium insidiosum]|nr:hypothetical protein PINS_up022918 [Pythium insidiosum]
MSASLAREELCTENLTPWPQDAAVSVARRTGALVDPIKLLSGDYLMLSIDAAGATPPPARSSLHQRLTDGAVAGGSTAVEPRGSLLSSQSASVVRACPLASSSQIVTEDVDRRAAFHVVDLQSQSGVSLTDVWSVPRPHPQEQTRTVNTHAVGRSPCIATSRATDKCTAASRCWLEKPATQTAPWTVVYRDVSPVYLRLYFHTLETRLSTVTPCTTFRSSRRSCAAAQTELQVTVRRAPAVQRLTPVVQFDKALCGSRGIRRTRTAASTLAPAGRRVLSSLTDSAACARALGDHASGPSRACAQRNPAAVACRRPTLAWPYNVITLSLDDHRVL